MPQKLCLLLAVVLTSNVLSERADACWGHRRMGCCQPYANCSTQPADCSCSSYSSYPVSSGCPSCLGVSTFSPSQSYVSTGRVYGSSSTGLMSGFGTISNCGFTDYCSSRTILTSGYSSYPGYGGGYGSYGYGSYGGGYGSYGGCGCGRRLLNFGCGSGSYGGGYGCGSCGVARSCYSGCGGYSSGLYGGYGRGMWGCGTRRSGCATSNCQATCGCAVPSCCAPMSNCCSGPSFGTTIMPTTPSTSVGTPMPNSPTPIDYPKADAAKPPAPKPEPPKPDDTDPPAPKLDDKNPGT